MQQVRPIVPHGFEGRQHEYRPARRPARANHARTMALSGLIRVHCAGDGPAPRGAPGVRPARARRARRRRRAARSGTSTGDPGPARPPLEGRVAADVAIIGGGFTGLWTAIRLLEADPALRVVVLEADRVARGRQRPQRRLLRRVAHPRPPQRAPPLPRRARAARGGGRRATCASSSRSCATRASTRSSRRPARSTSRPSRGRSTGSHEYVDLAAAHGDRARRSSTARRSRREVHSPRFLAGVRGGPERCVMVNPAKLAWGLADGRGAAGRADRRADSRVTAARPAGRAGRRPGRGRRASSTRTHVLVGDVRVQRAGCGGWRRTFVPVYDYALMTEPLTAGAARRDRLGAAARACPTRATSSTTSGSRPTTGSCGAATTRSTTRATRSSRRTTSARRRSTCSRGSSSRRSPSSTGIRFTHRWGGAIDTSTRFSVTFGEALGGRVHYALGYTGPRRRRDPLGGGRRCATWCSTRTRDAAPAALRPLAPVPDPARARADARRWSSCAAR